MKPLSVAIWHNLPSGGGKRALRQQVAGLQARGHRVKVWTSATADQDFLRLSDLVEERTLAWRHQDSNRVARALDPLRSFKDASNAMDGMCADAAREMVSEGFDVILAHGCRMFVVPPIAQKTKLPCVLYSQEPNRGVYEARPELRWVALRPQSAWPWSRSAVSQWREIARVGAAAAYERAEASKFDRILVNSYFSREAVVRCYGLDATVCYLGVDVDLFHPSSLQKQPYIVGLGAAEPHKGLELAVSTVALLPGNSPRRLIWMANMASAAYADDIRALAQRLNIAFELRHQVSESELVDTLGNAAAFLYCSTLEPFGFAPLEAMACGTPVVSVSEGGVREYIQHGVNGLLTGDRTPAALAEHLSAIVASPELTKRLGDAGRNTAVENWTLARAIDRLESHLQDVVSH